MIARFMSSLNSPPDIAGNCNCDVLLAIAESNAASERPTEEKASVIAATSRVGEVSRSVGSDWSEESVRSNGASTLLSATTSLSCSPFTFGSSACSGSNLNCGATMT